MLLTDDIKNNNDGDYPNVKYCLETPHYGLKAYKQRINPAVLPLGSRIVRNAKKSIAEVETVYTQDG